MTTGLRRPAFMRTASSDKLVNNNNKVETGGNTAHTGQNTLVGRSHLTPDFPVDDSLSSIPSCSSTSAICTSKKKPYGVWGSLPFCCPHFLNFPCSSCDMLGGFRSNWLPISECKVAHVLSGPAGAQHRGLYRHMSVQHANGANPH